MNQARYPRRWLDPVWATAVVFAVTCTADCIIPQAGETSVSQAYSGYCADSYLLRVRWYGESALLEIPKAEGSLG